ncbi:hypothetical protein LZZ85_21535 [Terrimonas sp. NA20]|uniref:PE-PGRS family protein n=1 Tax=Terrimonas ginsenosidimutans TaxID=2908004 RepID=A0ABS9KX19_9BACT|nr:hypothetical protein [Terrimonas ginsenosidimutans]MCG2616894.1 hypothetical protein [Terrimonas ginsenosidimutans]
MPVSIVKAIFVSLSFFTAVNLAPAAIFESTPVSHAVKPGKVDEASGIADSKTHPGYLWVEEDSGNPAEIYLLSHTGEYHKKIKIKGATNRDWEDIVLSAGPDPGKNYLYLGDIGNNKQTASKYFIYRFPEPALNTDTVHRFDKITYEYPDGGHDAEAFLVDHQTKDIYIITKRDKPSAIYKLPYPQSTTAVNTAQLVGRLGFNGVVSAALSPDGKELLLKTYTGVFYWKRKAGQTIGQVLATEPAQISYQLEPQGEAICFKSDNSGFFTLSEKPKFMKRVNLNFYKRVGR